MVARSGAPIAATGAGNLLVVAVKTYTFDTITSITDNAGNAYVAAPGAISTSSPTTDKLWIWYAEGSLAGATTVTINSPSPNNVVVWEFSGVRTTGSFHTASAVSERPSSTQPAGPLITTTMEGELIVAVTIVETVVTGTIAGNEFTNDLTTDGNGWAHLTSAAAPAGQYRAVWNQTTAGTYCASAAAFFPGP